MSTKKLIVLTLDGLTPAALGCYGSSWSSTPTIDSAAASGCVWDRLIANDVDPYRTLKQWLGSNEWIQAWKQHGSVELLSDSQDAISLASKSDFDQLFLIDPISDELPSEPAADLEGTQFAQLIAAATERINESKNGDDWGLLWLHSDFLTRCWDAPRWLLGTEMLDELEEEPLDEAETLEAEMIQAGLDPSDSIDALPEVFDTVIAPHESMGPDPHPDLVATWMSTYGCQIRLVDELLRVLLAALEESEVTIVVAGTSGYSLGQNDWIGHQAGPLRSCHVHLPLIVSGRGPLRIPQVSSANELPQIIAALGCSDNALVDPLHWSRSDDDSLQPRVNSRMSESEQAITTSRWFFVDQGDHDYRLYLKPDDIHDANDVSRLRPDVVDDFVATATNE